MRAVVIRSFGGPENLEVVDVPIPDPGPGEVLVKVGAATVNFADVIVRSGANVEYGATALREQFGLGTDLAGTVERLGEGVTRFAVGDAVTGTQERLDLPLGPQAEYAVLEEWALASAPVNASAVEATTLGLNGTTADEALDALGLVSGDWLLVTGAAGGVGLLGVELAQVRGLNVIAQASKSDEALLRDAGADLFVARDEDLVTAVRTLVPGGVHGALDAASLGAAASDAVRHGGSYVHLLAGAPMARREVRMTNLAWHTDAVRLDRLARLADAGRVSLRVARTFGLDEVAEAHVALARGGLRGRLVIVP